ncbi:MAG: hypothetical protein EA397_05065 [Deltaproteobacteria bacterium]|nr:MAG: hypothetical protein EA397_05065 [Deltaproteobacteria bacterium]
MDVALRGSSPGATTAAILLMTRARQLGLRLRVDIVGDPDDITPVPGPAVVHAPVLASCGVGRKDGMGATVVVSGPPTEPLLLSVQNDGTDGWFEVDRGQEGVHPATQAYVRLTRDARVDARHLAKDLRRALTGAGMSVETLILDILFGAPIPPLSRVAFALRAGRAISGQRGLPITRVLASHDFDRDPLGPDFQEDQVRAWLADGSLQWITDRLSLTVRDRVEDWVETAARVTAEDGGRDLVLVHALAELASHLVQLPSQSILPPLDAALDGVALCAGRALTATGDGNASFQLGQVFRFLGGQYVSDAPHVYDVDVHPPPDDRVERWRWFCKAAVIGQRRAEEVWPLIWDAPS